MSNIFFTSFDGTLWVNREYVKQIIENTLIKVNLGPYSKRFADMVLKELDTLKSIPIDGDGDDYFYCQTCKKGFPVRYTREMEKLAKRPCPTCGHDSRKTNKLKEGDFKE